MLLDHLGQLLFDHFLFHQIVSIKVDLMPQQVRVIFVSFVRAPVIKDQGLTDLKIRVRFPHLMSNIP
jgi:hypothetical protein